MLCCSNGTDKRSCRKIRQWYSPAGLQSGQPEENCDERYIKWTPYKTLTMIVYDSWTCTITDGWPALNQKTEIQAGRRCGSLVADSRHLESNTKLIGQHVPEIWKFSRWRISWHHHLNNPRIREHCIKMSAYSDKNCRRRQTDRETDRQTDTSTVNKGRVEPIKKKLKQDKVQFTVFVVRDELRKMTWRDINKTALDRHTSTKILIRQIQRSSIISIFFLHKTVVNVLNSYRSV